MSTDLQNSSLINCHNVIFAVSSPECGSLSVIWDESRRPLHLQSAPAAACHRQSRGGSCSSMSPTWRQTCRPCLMTLCNTLWAANGWDVVILRSFFSIHNHHAYLILLLNTLLWHLHGKSMKEEQLQLYFKSYGSQKIWPHWQYIVCIINNCRT